MGLTGFTPRRPGFTLSEMLVVTLVVLILMAGSIATYQRVQDHSKLAACLANLQTLSQASHLYLNTSPNLPSDLGSLGDGFRTCGLQSTNLRCPLDRRPGATDSYSAAYICRRQSDPPHVPVVLCGRHSDYARGLVLDLSGAVKTRDMEKTHFARVGGTAIPVLPGDGIEAGQLACSSNARVSVSDLSTHESLPVPVSRPNAPTFLGTYRDGDAERMTVFVPPASLGSFDVQSSGKAVVELVTSLAVIEVTGGRATVVTRRLSGLLNVAITSVSDTVSVRHRNMDRQTPLRAGATYEISE